MVITYFFILLNSIILKVGDAADTSFANSLGLDVICVFATVSAIKNTLHAVHEYSAYYYRVAGDKVKSGMYFTIILSVACTLPFIVFPECVELMFYIAPGQKKLLHDCVRVAFLYFPAEAVCEYLRNYLVYSGREKMANLSNFLYYICLLLLDAMAVFIFHSATGILMGTGLCCMCYATVVYMISGIRSDRYCIGDFSIIIKLGFPYFFNRILAKLCVLSINVMASRLGEAGYAAVSVCRKALEVAQMTIYPTQPMSVVKLRGKKHGCADILHAVKPVLGIMVVLFLTLEYVTLFFVRGNFSYMELLLPATVSGVTSMITYFLYCMTESCLVLENMQDIMAKSGVARVLATTALCILSVLPHGIYALLLYSTVSDLVVALYAFSALEKKKRLHIIS